MLDGKLPVQRYTSLEMFIVGCIASDGAGAPAVLRPRWRIAVVYDARVRWPHRPTEDAFSIVVPLRRERSRVI